ncbi:hypothetical protein HaLaN_32925 [Haematococcus lacustris]|uniref:Uncharacterized protein n=1 Tax=Haematococcus lacustris TaxID=44745 RepID=A0A6A0APE7_HAELA|nr:hypothetical protein HaLaN_32925 [Haematococcus lacustris]
MGEMPGQRSMDEHGPHHRLSSAQAGVEQRTHPATHFAPLEQQITGRHGSGSVRGSVRGIVPGSVRGRRFVVAVPGPAAVGQLCDAPVDRLRRKATSPGRAVWTSVRCPSSASSMPALTCSPPAGQAAGLPMQSHAAWDCMGNPCSPIPWLRPWWWAAGGPCLGQPLYSPTQAGQIPASRQLLVPPPLPSPPQLALATSSP